MQYCTINCCGGYKHKDGLTSFFVGHHPFWTTERFKLDIMGGYYHDNVRVWHAPGFSDLIATLPALNGKAHAKCKC